MTTLDYKVKIEIFEGPMDLLLHLIQKSDLDIYDIPISDITTEYLSYIELLKELNLNVAGEFLVMASTLMQIKARMLLPKDSIESEEDGPDPREELVQRLIEYQRFKSVAKELQGQFERNRDLMYRGAPIFNKADQVLEVNLTGLLEAFQNVLKQADSNVREIIMEEIPVEVRIREVLDALEEKPYLRFQDLFPTTATRKMLVITFLAVLELIRVKQVRVTQSDTFAEIHIERVQAEEETAEAEPELAAAENPAEGA